MQWGVQAKAVPDLPDGFLVYLFLAFGSADGNKSGHVAGCDAHDNEDEQCRPENRRDTQGEPSNCVLTQVYVTNLAG